MCFAGKRCAQANLHLPISAVSHVPFARGSFTRGTGYAQNVSVDFNKTDFGPETGKILTQTSYRWRTSHKRIPAELAYCPSKRQIQRTSELA